MRSDDWLSMDSAPLNPYGKAFGPVVLIWCAADDTPVACYYDCQGGPDNSPRWVTTTGDELGEGDAIAWMPIAKPWIVLEARHDR